MTGKWYNDLKMFVSKTWREEKKGGTLMSFDDDLKMMPEMKRKRSIKSGKCVYGQTDRHDTQNVRTSIKK